jgi:hypothetical protein
MVDEFNHAVKCAERFEAELRQKERPKSGCPSMAVVRPGAKVASAAGA